MPKLKQTSAPHGKPKNRTAAEAARLGISEDKLTELVKSGIIPVIKLGHSTHLFDPETTDAALRRHAARGQNSSIAYSGDIQAHGGLWNYLE